MCILTVFCIKIFISNTYSSIVWLGQKRICFSLWQTNNWLFMKPLDTTLHTKWCSQTKCRKVEGICSWVQPSNLYFTPSKKKKLFFNRLLMQCLYLKYNVSVLFVEFLVKVLNAVGNLIYRHCCKNQTYWTISPCFLLLLLSAGITKNS